MAIKFEDLPPQVQNQLRQLQQLQQQLEITVQQKLQIEIKLRETENALEELGKIEGEETVYKSIGNLIIKANKENLIKELKEDKETTEIRKKSIEEQEKRLKDRIEELQNKLQEELSK